jgi:hypothetical protein
MNRYRKILTVLTPSLMLAFGMTAGAHANVTWDWSFAGQAGTFTTDGSAPAGTAAAGSYNLLDFSVTTSTAGESVGSVSGGQYSETGFDTNPPYSFNWDGSNVVQWNQSGLNTFNWWAFNDNLSPDLYVFFAETPDNVNDPTNATVFNFNPGVFVASGTVNVAPATAAPVPEPDTYALLFAGLGLLGVVAKRRQKAVD